MASKKLIKVRVRDTEATIFEGEVDRISSFNEVGPFDVFHTHANFISIIRQKLSLYANNQKIKEMELGQAVMKVKKNSVHIFVGIESFSLGEEKAAKSST